MKNIARLVWFDRDSLFVGPLGNWVGLHVDHPWSEDVREFCAPCRAYVHLGPLGGVTVGLPTRDELEIDWDAHTARTVRVPWHLARQQSWRPSRGYTGTWRVVAYSPKRWMTCREEVGEVRVGRSGQEWREECGALRWHRGPHREPRGYQTD